MFETIGWIKRGETPAPDREKQSGREMTAEVFDAVFG